MLATIAVGLASFSFIQFSRYFAHSGSVYAFNGIALGSRAGFFSGWALFGTYLVFTAASTAEAGNFAQTFFSELHVNIDWLLLAVVTGAIIWVLAYSDIGLSTRLTLILEGVSILLIAILTVIILSRGGASGQLTAQPFVPGNQPFSNVGLAAVFGFLSFAGFEGAATLGEETRNPRRNIPLAILVAVAGTGIFYVIVTYAQTVGFGTNDAGIKAFASSTAPLGDLGQRYVGPVMSALINLGATISAFASALGTANAGSRILYSMGRDGFISERLGSTSRRTGSPAIALAVVMVVTFIIILAWSRAPGINGAALFGYLGTIGVFLILVAYIMTNIGAIRFFMARRLWTWQWIIPVAAILILGYTLYSNLYPVPAPPSNLLPYVALVWLLVGLIIILVSPALADTLEIEFLDLQPADWGWTAIIPGFGLLADEFPEPALKIWHLEGDANGVAEFAPGIRIPLAPFCGEIGLAPAAAGALSTIPPYRHGGNMDTKHLTRGAHLYLPVEVPGALFSLGDGHAAQGDGEVCGTAIETPMRATVRLTVHKDFSVDEPQFLTSGPLIQRINTAPYYATDGIGPDLVEATKKAVRHMIRHLQRAYGLPREDAYMLCSVVVDLKLCEVVDMPNWTVGAFLPQSIFVSQS